MPKKPSKTRVTLETILTEIKRFESKTNDRFDLIKTDFSDIRSEFTNVRSELSGIRSVLDEHGKRLDEHGKRLDEHGKRLDSIANDVRIIRTQTGQITERVTALESKDRSPVV